MVSTQLSYLILGILKNKEFIINIIYVIIKMICHIFTKLRYIYSVRNKMVMMCNQIFLEVRICKRNITEFNLFYRISFYFGGNIIKLTLLLFYTYFISIPTNKIDFLRFQAASTSSNFFLKRTHDVITKNK